MRYGKVYSLLIVFFAFLVAGIQAQDKREISGKVSTLNDIPVANLEVEARKSDAKVMTDSTGKFSILIEPKDVLLFKSKVFKNERVRVKEEKTDSVFVNLKFIPTQRNRERAIVYGYVPEEDLLNAVSHVSNDEVDFCQYSDVFEIIKGRFSGVEIKGTGYNAKVVIRGSISFEGSNEALYIVDGLEVNSINNIHPCDVKSIDVLKDSGASMYGSQGANGVVLIETRGGNE